MKINSLLNRDGVNQCRCHHDLAVSCTGRGCLSFYAGQHPPLSPPKWQANKQELLSLAATSPAKALWGNASCNDLLILYSWSGRPLQVPGLWQVFRVRAERVDERGRLPVQARLCQPGRAALPQPVRAAAPPLCQRRQVRAGARQRSCLQVNRLMTSVNSPINHANKPKARHSDAVSHTANTRLKYK